MQPPFLTPGQGITVFPDSLRDFSPHHWSEPFQPLHAHLLFLNKLCFEAQVHIADPEPPRKHTLCAELQAMHAYIDAFIQSLDV